MIHPTAVVHPEATIESDVEVGPFVVVGARVVIGRGTRVLAHAVIEGPTRLGEANVVHPFAVVGGQAQHKRYHDGWGELVVGSYNVVREHATVHRGTDGRATVVGSHCLLMAGSHVAHDVELGSHIVLANAVQIAGHARVHDHATFGGLSGVAQHVVVGESAFVAAGAMCERDVLPFVVVQGDRARVRALNKVGLERRGVPAVSIARLERAFWMLFGSNLPRSSALTQLSAWPDVADDPFVQRLLAVVAGAT
jgi:UDP-N-acetylglucosamine acyltransferase